jgi:ribosome-binding ATPase
MNPAAMAASGPRPVAPQTECKKCCTTTLIALRLTTTETSTGVAQVPDHRLDALAVMSSSKKVVHAGVELVDIAGLVAGSSTGEGLGNRFLGGIREADAICLVLRAFEDDNVAGSHDPLEDLTVLELELVLADLSSAESQLERRRKAAKQDKSQAGQVAALERAHAALADGTPLYRAGLGVRPATARCSMRADRH